MCRINSMKKGLSIPAHSQRRIEEHTEILEAIQNRDTKGSREKMYAHLTDIEKYFFSG